MMRYKDFTEMPTWKLAYKLSLRIYEITSTFPLEEKYGLVSDMRRAANSISNNLAEGFGRFEAYDKTRFYKISRGSCYELMNQSMLSEGLKFMDTKVKDEILNTCEEIIKGLDSMIKTIETTRGQYKKRK